MEATTTAGRGAPALRVVAALTLLAVLAAGVLVTWARLGARSADDDAVELAFGVEPGPLPPVLPPEAEDALVIGARAPDGPPRGAGGCPVSGNGDALFVAVPEAVLGYEDLGGGAQTCVLMPGGSSSASGFDGEVPGGIIGTGCCTPDGWGWSEAVVDAPDGARWALQDRGGWWVSYPVAGPRVHLLWTHGSGADPGSSGQPITPVLFLDERGSVIGGAGA